MNNGLTKAEERTVWIHLSAYSTSGDFTAREWFDANDRVRSSDKLKAYIRKLGR